MNIGDIDLPKCLSLEATFPLGENVASIVKGGSEDLLFEHRLLRLNSQIYLLPDE